MRIKTKIIKTGSFFFPCIDVMRQHIDVDVDNLRVVWTAGEDEEGKFIKFYFDNEAKENKLNNIVENEKIVTDNNIIDNENIVENENIVNNSMDFSL